MKLLIKMNLYVPQTTRSTPLEFKEGSLSLKQQNNNGFDASVEVSGGFDLRQFVVSGS